MSSSPEKLKNAVADSSSQHRPTNNTVALSNDIEGKIRVDANQGITGWIWDRTKPYEALKLDLVVGEIKIATTMADKFDMELVESRKGNGRHAFAFKAETWPDVQLPTTAVIKISKTDIVVAKIPINTLNQISTVAAHAPVGHVDGIVDGKITGWAWDRANPAVPTSIDIYQDNTLLATISASLFREDLFKAQYGDGRCGFSFSLPTSLLDTKLRTITVCFKGTTIQLANGTKIFGYPHEAALHTYISDLNKEIIGLKQELSTVEKRLMDRHEALLTIQRDNIEQELQVIRKIIIDSAMQSTSMHLKEQKESLTAINFPEPKREKK